MKNKKILFLSIGVGLLLVGLFIFWLINPEYFEDMIYYNLGKVLALIGFLFTFIIYIISDKGLTLFVGIIISLIGGGIVGMSGSFLNTTGCADFSFEEPTKKEISAVKNEK